MKKTIVAVLLVLVVLFGFASCAKKAEAAAPAAPAAPAAQAKAAEPEKNPKDVLGTKPVTITVWHCNSEEADTEFQKMVDEFNSSNNYQITVNAIYQGQYTDARTLMQSVVQAENWKELPDMMQLDATGKAAYIESGKAFTVDDAIAYFKDDIRSQYLKGAMGNWQLGGKQLGLPFATSTTITFYNATLLKKAGWDHCPDTFEDIIKLAADMKKAGLTEVCYQDVPNTPSLANWLGQLGSYMMDNANEGSKLACIDNGALKTFLAAWKSMYDAGALANKGSSSSDFIAGKVAVFTNSTSNITSLNDKIGGNFELGASTFLRVNDKASYGATLSGSCMVMFDSGEDLKKAATWEFLKFITNAENQAAFAAGTGYTPAHVDSANTEVYKNYVAKYPQNAVVAQQLADTPADMRGAAPHSSVNYDFYMGIMNEVQSFLNENKTVEAATKSLGDLLQGLLDKAARLAD